MIKNCLFPVAGFGTRFLPVTKSIPKEMLPILSKPLIHYSVQEATEAGINNFAIVLNKNKNAIKDYFSEYKELDEILISNNKTNLIQSLNNIIDSCNFSYVNQTKMLGLGHAILQAENLLNGDPFGVILPDDLCFTDELSVLNQMVQIYKKNPQKNIIAVEEVDNSSIHKYGVIDGIEVDEDIYAVKGMIEKPLAKDAPSNLAIIGRYILQPNVFGILKEIKPDIRGEVQITDALNILAMKGEVLALKFKGKRIDCGSMEGYIEANNFLASI